jgi:hypothetical protein
MNKSQKLIAYQAIDNNVEHTTARQIIRYVMECELWGQDTVSPTNKHLAKKYKWSVDTTKVAISKAKKSQFISTTGYGKQRCLELNVSFLKGKMAEAYQKTLKPKTDFSDIITENKKSANGLANGLANTLANSSANSFLEEKCLTEPRIDIIKEDNNNNNNNNYIADKKSATKTPPEEKFNQEEYIDGMKKNKLPHIRFIGWYFEKRKSNFPTKESIQIETKRWLKDASFIVKYPQIKVSKAYELVRQKYPDEWNMSTIRKVIPEA